MGGSSGSCSQVRWQCSYLWRLVGLFKYTPTTIWCFGSTSYLQRTMDTILQGIPGVAVYVDVILVAGSSQEDHLSTLDAVLARLEAARLWLKRSKCVFLASSVEYLGHVFCEGLHPSKEKVHAIREAPNPTNFPGNDCLLFKVHIPNLASMLSPLYLLLHKGKWGEAERAAFEKARSTLINFSPSALQSWKITCLGLRCISIWDWCSPLPSIRRRNPAQANCFCKPHLGSSRKKLFPVEERKSGTADHKPLEGIFHSLRQLSSMATA